MTFKRNNLSQDVIHALTLTLVLCLTLLSGCSDKEEILPPEPEEGTDIVSEYKAYVGHPFNASLGEQTNGYTIKNNDPEKLKTEYFGIEHFGVVCIFPLCEGESSIHVLDKNNKLVKNNKNTNHHVGKQGCGSGKRSSSLCQTGSTSRSTRHTNQTKYRKRTDAGTEKQKRYTLYIRQPDPTIYHDFSRWGEKDMKGPTNVE